VWTMTTSRDESEGLYVPFAMLILGGSQTRLKASSVLFFIFSGEG